MRSFWPKGGLWRHPDFLKLWSAETISMFGSTIDDIAFALVAILVLDATAFEVAALGTVLFLPFILFTLPAGDCLERGERYAWSVAATGHDGTLAWAEPFLFEVEAAPSAEELEQKMATIRRHLEDAEVAAFDALVEDTMRSHTDDFDSRFVAESPDRLRRLPRYYAALAGLGPFPPVSCNAPWMSVVIEADGTVRPCFFHAPVGNIREQSLETIVGTNLPTFRRSLRVSRDGRCQRCVCSIRTSWWNAPWQ